MSRYVRVNALPGFPNVRDFYWFDSMEKRVLSFPASDSSFDPNLINTFRDYTNVIGSVQNGDVRYNFTTNGRYNQSAQLRKIKHAYARMTSTACQEANQEVAPTTSAKFAVIRLANNCVAARDLNEADARKLIENRIKNNGGEYMLVQQVAIAKATNSVAWV